MSSELIKICAQLASSGKKPSVALLKAKARGKYHLTELVSALNTWQANPNFEAEEEAQSQASVIESETIDMATRVTRLEAENLELHKRITELESLVVKLRNDSR